MHDNISPEEYNTYIEEIDALSQDILFSLNTNFPVSTINEYHLCALLEDMNTLELCQQSASLCQLQEFFLDNSDCGDAWNLRNLLINF